MASITGRVTKIDVLTQFISTDDTRALAFFVEGRSDPLFSNSSFIDMIHVHAE